MISMGLLHFTCAPCPSSKNFEKDLPLYLSGEVPVISKAVETDGDRLCDGAHALLESLTLRGQPHGLAGPGQGVNVVALLELSGEVTHQSLVK